MNWISHHFEEVLKAFFTKYKPKHMDKVADIAAEFKGMEVQCIEKLCSRYYVDFNAFVKSLEKEMNINPSEYGAPEVVNSESSQASDSENSEEVESDDELEEEVPKKKKSKLIWIILIVIILGGGGAGYFFFMPQGDGAESEANTEEVTEEPALEKAEIEDPVLEQDSTMMEEVDSLNTPSDSLTLEEIDQLLSGEEEMPAEAEE